MDETVTKPKTHSNAILKHCVYTHTPIQNKILLLYVVSKC